MRTAARKADRDQPLLTRLANLSDQVKRKKFLLRRPRTCRPEFVDRLAQEVHRTVRIDVRKALALAEAALLIAERIGGESLIALSLRAKGNALYALGQNQAALDLYEKAISLFEKAGQSKEVARTLSTSIQPFILLSQYEAAFAAAERARQIFTREGDGRGLARLEIPVGNIFHRQDRFDEALGCYQRAYRRLLPLNDAEGIAAALSNTALCLTVLNDFPRALATYQQARSFCQQQGMPILVAQADYNVAYLYYLRGEYSRAIEMLRATREACRKTGDLYHFALCNVDQSEIYLELNLNAEAAELARAAFASFKELGTGYETAKCLTNLAIALSHQGKAFRALGLFAQAREMFIREKNRVWTSLIDLYRALVLYDEGRFFESRRLCNAALEFFRDSVLPGKAVLCRLLLARLSLRIGDLGTARLECGAALEQLARLEAPLLTYEGRFLQGEIEEASGNRQAAFDCYQIARQALETLRSSLRGEEPKIAFMKNKLAVYERLVELTLNRNPAQNGAEEAFGYMEQAKSRSLLDLIFRPVHSLPPTPPGESELVRRVRELREELNWYYHRIEIEQLRQGESSPQRIEQLQGRARAQENELLHALRELPASEAEYGALYRATSLPLETIRASLPADSTLVEYYRVGERIFAAVLTRQSLEIAPLTLASRVESLVRMLRFQLSKFRLSPDYLRTFADLLFTATQTHLEELYQELVAPLRPLLGSGHLIIVPHGVLHYLPFHALFDGRQHLIDSFTISYAPSASIHALCQGKSANRTGPALILGVPDPQAPFILEEVDSVAAIVPEPLVFLGADASEEKLKEIGPRSRLIHIASHGYFRQDNPMFSAIRLGQSYLSLYDLYQLKLPVELVTLSGCATGLNVVVGGDELLGLVRGLLYAGTPSLLVTLWEVQDTSTAEFMKLLYERLRDTRDKAAALREAMRTMRQSYPHPYYWAPFVLVGRTSSP